MPFARPLLEHSAPSSLNAFPLLHRLTITGSVHCAWHAAQDRWPSSTGASACSAAAAALAAATRGMEANCACPFLLSASIRASALALESVWFSLPLVRWHWAHRAKSAWYSLLVD